MGFKSDAPELLAQLFNSMGFDLKSWYSWDTDYAEDSELMLGALACPKKLSLLRLKLTAMGIDVNAINAVRDYRDLKD